MISDDAPDPRNGKIIQCRVLARTLSVPWAGSLARPWREAPCHYVAGLHHPHQYPIFGASLYNQRGLHKSFCSAPFALLSFSAACSISFLVGDPLLSSSLVLLFYATIQRHCPRLYHVCIAWIVKRREKVFACALRVSRLLTLFKTKYRKIA